MKNATKFNYLADIFTQKWSKTHHASSLFHEFTPENKKFAASRTEIDSVTCHDQTLNHDITPKYIKSTFSRKKMTPKTHHAKCVCVGGGGGGGGGL